MVPWRCAAFMGGQHTAVGEHTRDIFLESAFFSPGAMAGKARSLGMHTDASHRYERGVDFELQVAAIERATQLLLDIVGGQAGPVVLASAGEHLPALNAIRLRAERLDTMLGVSLPSGQVEDILRRLGLGVERHGAGWLVRPPSFRFDIRIEVDLIEEIARVHGYDRIPVRVQSAAVPIRPRSEAQHSLAAWRHRLNALGTRKPSPTASSSRASRRCWIRKRTPVPVANPISADMAVMRTTLWAGLIKAAQFNQNRQQRSLRLFESGLRFLPGPDGLEQRLAVAGVACGDRGQEGWPARRRARFLRPEGRRGGAARYRSDRGAIRVRAGHASGAASGAVGVAAREGEPLGYLGALHPELLKQFDCRGRFTFSSSISRWRARKTCQVFKGLSKFPEVRRDIAIVLDEEVSRRARAGSGAAGGGRTARELEVV